MNGEARNNMKHSLPLGKTNNLTSSRAPGKESGKGEAIPKIGDCFALSHRSHAGARKDVILLFCSSLLALFFTSCSTDPEPLVYGTDICHFCKMTMMDNKFGAELVTKKGKVYKFDDMNCFLNFYNSGYENVEDFHHKLVIDYANPGKLIDASNGFYLTSAAIRSPMNGQVAAFETKASMDTFKKEWKAIYLGWGEVTTQYK